MDDSGTLPGRERAISTGSAYCPPRSEQQTGLRETPRTVPSAPPPTRQAQLEPPSRVQPAKRMSGAPRCVHLGMSEDEVHPEPTLGMALPGTPTTFRTPVTEA